jgi:Repeat of unknown function (DUF346)
VPVLNSSTARRSAAVIVAAATLFASPLFGETNAKALGLGPAGWYDFSSAGCSANDHTDPIGVLFRGKKAWADNVHDHIERHSSWDQGGASDHYLWVLTAGGDYECRNTNVHNASHAEGPFDRSHVRLWFIPASGENEYKTIGTPHFDEYVVGNGCGFPIGKHSVPESMLIPDWDKDGLTTYESGFDYSKKLLMYKMQGDGHPVASEWWGNTAKFPQCDGDESASNGVGYHIWVNQKKGDPPRTKRASTSATGATLYGTVYPEEETPTEWWFAYGTESSQGTGYPYKTPVRSTSGSAEVDVTEPISGLGTNTTHYVRLFARFSDGEVVEGNEIRYCSAVDEEDDNSPGPRVIARCDNGIVDVFYRMPAGDLGHDWWGPTTGWVHEVHDASIAKSSVPHVISHPNGIVNVFFRTESNDLGNYWWGPTTGWAYETHDAALKSDPHPINHENGIVNVFFRTQNDDLGNYWWGPTTGWAYEVHDATMASDPHPINHENGIVNVFFRTQNDDLGNYWWGPTTGWAYEVRPVTLGGDPKPINQENGIVNVFYRTPEGDLGNAWWGPTTGWAHEVKYGAPLASDPHPIVHTNGVVDVFYRTPSSQLGHWWWAATGGWGHEALQGPVSGDPHPVAIGNGIVNVFSRTAPNGNLVNDWWGPTTGWTHEVRAATVAARPPTASTEAASAVGGSKATLNATVNPEGSPTSYYFEYGTTTAYGSKWPIAAERAGSNVYDTSVSHELSGLQPETTYHYRVVAESPEGTIKGQDSTFTTQSISIAEALAAMAVTEPFDGSSASLANFESSFSALGWAGGTAAKGTDTTTGWRPANAFPTVNGAYHHPDVPSGGMGTAAVATMAASPALAERHFSIWLDMPTPATARAGYELRFTYVSTDTYNVKLSKWVSGAETVLASKQGYILPMGSSLGLIDQGGSVSAWTKTASTFSQLLSAGDSAFDAGRAGFTGAGNNTRLTNFKADALGEAAPAVENWHNGNIGGTLTSDPDVSSSAPGRIDVFARGTDNALWHKYRTGETWVGWSSRGGQLTSAPGAVSWGNNRIDVVARTTNNTIQHWYWGGTAWYSDNLGGTLTSAPDISSWASNRLDVFARGTDNALWRRQWNGSSWTAWAKIGGTLASGPGAVSWGPNRIDVVARAGDNSVLYWWWDGAGWQSGNLGGSIASDPDIVSTASGYLDVFARGTDGALWRLSRTSSGWGQWQRMGDWIVGGAGAVSAEPNQIDLFARRTFNATLSHWWWEP